jgi:formate dehydrogenase subunit beta
MLGLLRQRCRQLLQDGTVQVVIGYGQTEPDTPVVPVFITDPNQADQLTWNDACHFNLVTYLNHAAIRALGRAAICVKACDERALVVLEQESQIRREDLYVIGIGCDGVDQPRSEKCRSCEERTPRFADERIGDTAGNHAEAAGRYQPLEAFLEKTPAERMRYWQEEFARCTRCYACRQVCPLCYCSTCIVDKNRPHANRHLGDAQGEFRVAYHPCLSPGRPLRGLRSMHPRVPRRNRLAVAAPVPGPRGRQTLRAHRGAIARVRTAHRQLLGKGP